MGMGMGMGMGMVMEQSIKEIWDGEGFQHYRGMHQEDGSRIDMLQERWNNILLSKKS